MLPDTTYGDFHSHCAEWLRAQAMDPDFRGLKLLYSLLALKCQETFFQDRGWNPRALHARQVLHQ